MNRIVLIGNGFDLAHGMKTKYHDFINDYWDKVISELHGSYGRSFQNSLLSVGFVPPMREIKQITPKELQNHVAGYQSRCIIHNKFLWDIIEKSSLESWVDIEQEFYYKLIQIAINQSTNKNLEFITELNEQFNDILRLLKEYIENLDNSKPPKNPKITTQIFKHIYGDTEIKDLSEEAKERLASIEFELYKYKLDKLRQSKYDFKSFSGKDKEVLEHIYMQHNQKEGLKKYMFSDIGKHHFNYSPANTLLLSFNYTSTHLNYDDPKIGNNELKIIPNVKKIQIHGSIHSDDKNPIIFGYGDELDKDYSLLENLNQNQYLEFIKSMKYSERRNYKNLLEFIESDHFHVYVMGHSCGISDRTLLNNIFEHDNCSFIKTFYHKWKDEEGNVHDDFSNIIRNISRNFNSKSKMRDRVVNFEYCKALIV